MELKEIFQTISRRLTLLMLVIITIASSVGYFTITSKEAYETSSLITIQSSREATSQYQYGGFYAIQSSELFINTITGWIKNTNIVSEIYTRAGIEFDRNKVETLGKNIYARKVPPQNLVLIIKDQDRDSSIKIAESTIDVVRDRIDQMSLVANAAADFEILSSSLITRNVRPNIYLNILISIIIGFLFGTILIFVFEYFSPTINCPSRIKNIFKKDPVSFKGMKIKGLIHPETKESEKFRFLRANINSQEEPKTSIIISSLNEQESPSLIASNLALSFARSGKKTILVDTCFGNALVHEYFNRPNDFGFSEFLFDENNLDKYLQNTDENNLRIISAGMKLAYASDSIERSNLKKIINEIEKESDIIIFNVPPLNQSSEAFPLFSVIKKTVLVIKLGKTNIAAANFINLFLTKKDVEKNIIII